MIGNDSRGRDKLIKKDGDPGRGGPLPGRQDRITGRTKVGVKELDQRWQRGGRTRSIHVCSDGQGKAGTVTIEEIMVTISGPHCVGDLCSIALEWLFSVIDNYFRRSRQP